MTMRIQSSFLAVACGLSLSAAVADDAKPAGKATSAPSRELTVSPKAIERPLTKYRLFPAEYELRDGNAAPILDRLPWERTKYFADVVPKFGEYLDVPLESPKLRDHEIFAFFPQLKRAAYRKTADWQYPIGEEPVADIALSDVQGARYVVGNGLSVWIRQRLAEGQLDRAREGILVGLAVARHYGRTPFVITQLVCCVIDSNLLARVEELISQPDSPNLYWALAQLPRPLVDMRPSIELEQRFLPMTVPGLDDLGQIKTKEEWTGRALAVLRYLREPGQQNPEPGKTAAAFEQVVKIARAELPEWTEGGAKRVAEMSDGEAALRWLIDVYDDLMGEMAAAMSLEPPVALPRLAALHTRFKDYQAAVGAPKGNLAVGGVTTYIAPYKLERQIDALRTVEAIRHYAAGHDSRLPESLDKISDLPIPNDLFTGKPFHYEVKDGAAILWGDTIPLPDLDREPLAIHYTIRIRK
jgi:hypothetical protein